MERPGGRLWKARGPALGALLAGLMVALSGWVDVNRYFNIQMHDAAVFEEHSASATFAGREAAMLPPGMRIVMDERLIGEPTIQFLAPNIPKPEGYRPSLLPLTVNRPTALFLGGDQTPDLEYLQRLYPHAAVKRFSPPYGGPVLLFEALVDEPDVAAIQGVNVEYRLPNGPARQERAPNFDLDLGRAAAPLSSEARLSSALVAPAAGEYGFQVEGPPSARLSIDGRDVAGAGDPVQVSLPGGAHYVEIAAEAQQSGGAHVRLLWRPPNAAELAPVPSQRLFATPAVENGLLGSYFPNGTWIGPASFSQVDPFVSFYFQVLPLPLPFSVEWTGQIAAPVDGVYRFSTSSIDSSQVFVDGARLANEAPVSLSAGRHDIRVRFEAHSGHNHVELRWQPPGRDWTVVPAAFLFPSASVGVAEPLPALPGAAARGGAAQAEPTLLASLWQAGPERLSGSNGPPSGVALDGQGHILVLNGAAHAIVQLDQGGAVVSTMAPAALASVSDLTAIAPAAGGGALLLDAASGAVLRVSPDGRFVDTVAGDLGAYHPRGLAAAAGGDMFVADTGRSRVLHLSPTGNLLGQLGSRGANRGQFDQPCGAAVTPDGGVVVVDPGARKLVAFTASGAVRWETAFDAGPTVFGPQVAVSSDGSIWVSDPDAGRLLRYSPDGKLEGGYATAAGLDHPSGLAAGDGFLVVAEPGQKRVQMLKLP